MACSLGGCNGLKRKFENIEVALPFFLFSALVIIPLLLALDRLIYVSGKMPWQVFSSLDEHYLSQDAIGFTFLQALLSTALTLAIGIPIAWQLGRYHWPRIRLMRALLTLPFVTPAIVAAMGFMAILGSDGFDLRGDKSTYLVSLLFAHAWFNIALVIRFVDPVISNLDPRMEEQLRLLPAGNSRWGRLRCFWIPLMFPSILCAAVLTFVFSFTSFAMVRWMTPSNATLETVMADVGGAAGIENYQIYSNELVLASSTIQFLVLILALWLLSALQAKRSRTIAEVSESHSRKKGRTGWLVLIPALLFCLSPLMAVIRSSLRVAERGPVISHRWTLEGWQSAISGDYAYISIIDALQNSLGYAILTLVISLPLGWSLSSGIHLLEKKGLLLGQTARYLDYVTIGNIWSDAGSGHIARDNQNLDGILYDVVDSCNTPYYAVNSLCCPFTATSNETSRSRVNRECSGIGHESMADINQDSHATITWAVNRRRNNCHSHVDGRIWSILDTCPYRCLGHITCIGRPVDDTSWFRSISQAHCDGSCKPIDADHLDLVLGRRKIQTRW